MSSTGTPVAVVRVSPPCAHAGATVSLGAPSDLVDLRRALEPAGLAMIPFRAEPRSGHAVSGYLPASLPRNPDTARPVATDPRAVTTVGGRRHAAAAVGLRCRAGCHAERFRPERAHHASASPYRMPDT